MLFAGLESQLKKSFLVLLVMGISGCSQLSGASRAQTAAGSFSYVLTGAESPYTLVLEAGLGDDMNSWSGLVSELASSSRVFAYNRAGYGASQVSQDRGDGLTKVNQLRQLLKHTNTRPPYVLVGHSLGGTLMELFARSHPEEVVGLVLLDSRAAEFTALCRSDQAAFCEPPALLKALLPKAAKRELAAEPTTMSQIRQAPAFPEIPVAVVTGMNKSIEGPKFRQVWMTTQQQLATLSPISRHLICESCGHYVHHDNPTQVIAAIKWVLSQVARF